MYQLYTQQQAVIDLGWEFNGPLLVMLLMIIMAVPIWVVLGLGSIAILLTTEVLPLSLFGEALFDGIDALIYHIVNDSIQNKHFHLNVHFSLKHPNP